MRDIALSLALECDCRNTVSATHNIPNNLIVGGTAMTGYYQCDQCGIKYFVHIQQVKPK